MQPILPIAGVPDELLRVLNDRFRQLAGSSAAAAAAPPATTIEKRVLVNTGGALYGTHAGRLGLAAAGNPNAVYFEVDRGNVAYQAQNGAWAYVSGMFASTAINRPTDLGRSDAGFPFLATDTLAGYYWTGAAWVTWVSPIPAIPQDNLVQYAQASANLVLGAQADVPGATLILTRAGQHWIHGTFDMDATSAADSLGVGYLVADGVTQGAQAVFRITAATGRAAISQSWIWTAAAAGKIVKLQAALGAGGMTCHISHTSISALWIAP